MPYQSNTDVTTLLSPNVTSTKNYLTQTGTGTNGAAPAWGTIAIADVPTLNQNTTGSAATLTTPRTIGGTSFNGSADITVASATAGFTITGGATALAAGTTGISPLTFASGTNLSSATIGACEFDGTAYYKTVDTTSGRTQVANHNIFRLTANGSAIGAGIADFFGANSSFPTVLNGVYEIIFDIYYLKTTAGTVTYTITNTQAYTNSVFSYIQSPAAGITPNATPTYAGLVTNTTAAAALPATASLTTAVNHHARIYCLVECGTAGNIRLRVTESAGTVTPLRGSYYTARRLFAGNVGTFVS
jgi:hypothetical protein